MVVVRLLAVLMIWLGAANASLADDKAACIAACETPAIACADSTRTAKTKCVRSVRESCRGTPMAQLPVCVKAASKACVDTHNPAIEACDTTFKACHKACHGDVAIKRGYWCMHQADDQAEITRKTGYCDLEQSQASLDACLKKFDLPAKAGSTVTTECQPL